MQKLEFLEKIKKVMLLPEIFQEHNTHNFSKISIEINTQLKNSEMLISVFDALGIPYKSSTINFEKRSTYSYDDGIVLEVGNMVDFKMLRYILFVTKEVFNDEDWITIYIGYATHPEGVNRTISFGIRDHSYNIYPNMSEAVDIKEIIALNNTEDWISLRRKVYSRKNYCISGFCTPEQYASYEEHKQNEEWERRCNGDFDDYDEYFYMDYDREKFNALTDGQYGEYDDWKDNGGDFDSLMDGLGY